MGRAERRATADRYRRVDVQHVCDIVVYAADSGAGIPFRPCGQTLVATFVVERGDPTPAVTFRHNPDGSHEPVIGGTGAAATARRNSQVMGDIVNRKVDA